MSERTIENAVEWMTLKNVRPFLEGLREEHGEKYEFATRAVTNCVIVKFIEHSLPGVKVRECNYGVADLEDEQEVRWHDTHHTAGSRHEVGRYIKRVDNSGDMDTPITVDMAISLLDEDR